MKFINLKAFRKYHHITQRALSEATGIPQPTIAGIETGRSNMSNDIKEKILQAYPETDPESFSVKDSEPVLQSIYSEMGAGPLFDMFMLKDKQLTDCMAENARLLREIIELKDMIAKEREMTKSGSKATPKLS